MHVPGTLCHLRGKSWCIVKQHMNRKPIDAPTQNYDHYDMILKIVICNLARVCTSRLWGKIGCKTIHNAQNQSMRNSIMKSAMTKDNSSGNDDDVAVNDVHRAKPMQMIKVYHTRPERRTWRSLYFLNGARNCLATAQSLQNAPCVTIFSHHLHNYRNNPFFTKLNCVKCKPKKFLPWKQFVKLYSTSKGWSETSDLVWVNAIETVHCPGRRAEPVSTGAFPALPVQEYGSLENHP